ncbi:MAG: glyceraldehyde 3-phosphate dehydrogenase NAD-binding domain-containing protein, partial [Vulcanococcus sp.]
MTLKVAINGFGRIGRNFMRCWLSRGSNTGIEVVGINGSGDTNTN